MSDEQNQEIPMAECGSCQTIIPLDSESCPNCGIRFGGVSEEHLGECGACGELQPVDSTSCSNCGVSFVNEDVPVEQPISEPEIVHEVAELEEIVEATIDDTPEDSVIDISVDDANDILAEESMAEPATDYDEESQEESPEDVELSETDDGAEAETSDELEASKEVLEDDLEEDSEQEEETIDSEEVEGSEIGADDDEEVDDSEDDVSEDESEDEEEEEVDNTLAIMAFENLALSIAGTGMTASEAFMEMDTSDDNLIDAPELQKGIEKIGGEKLKPSEVTAILNYIDSNENSRVDPAELINALEDLHIGINPGKMPKSKRVKEFPSPAQKFLMGKTANDIFYPVAYFLMVTIVGLFVANGFAIPGASGEGGNVLYEGEGENWNHCGTEIGDTLGDTCSGFVNDGEIYPCDATVDPNECRNSITIFSGENSDFGIDSMPKGFYLDGIMFIIIGIIGIGATAYLHMVYAPSLRQRAKSDDNSVEESSEDEEESVLEAPKDLEIESQYDDEDELGDDESEDEDDEPEDEDDESDDDDDESDDDDDESDDDEEDDDIDIGDWVGIDIDGEEFFGEIVEFDDDEGTVTIETEEGDEVTGDQDDMFIDDEDDDE